MSLDKLAVLAQGYLGYEGPALTRLEPKAGVGGVSYGHDWLAPSSLRSRRPVFEMAEGVRERLGSPAQISKLGRHCSPAPPKALFGKWDVAKASCSLLLGKP